MSKIWVQAIIIQNRRVIFGYGKGHHYFIGKVLEDDETPEQGLRQALREVNVDGVVLFRVAEPDAEEAWGQSAFLPHITFLVDIGYQVPAISLNMELSDAANRDRALVRIELIPLDQPEAFTEIDIGYFRLLLADCETRGVRFPWTDAMSTLIQAKRLNS